MAKTSLHCCDPNDTLLFAGGAPAGCSGSLVIVTSTDAPLKLLPPLLEDGQPGMPWREPHCFHGHQSRSFFFPLLEAAADATF
jgi:hypothetical protein